MEAWEKDHILKNIDKLVEITSCNVTFLTSFLAVGIFSQTDLEELKILENQTGSRKQAQRFYEILITRQNGFQQLEKALQITKQTGVLAILNTNFSDTLSITYDEKQVLGKGSNATVVYKGKFGTRDDVAVKRVLLDTAERNNTISEIEVLKKCDKHENIVRYFGSKQEQNHVLIALELCNMTLSKWIEEKSIEITQVEILRQATVGLKWLHSRNIIHRDLKPENILLTSDLIRVKISDFGLSRPVIDGKTSVLTATGGTDGWIAPEILSQMEKERSEANYSFASDVFALGCVYYYVLTDGKHAFGTKVRRQTNIIDGNDTFDEAAVLFCCSQNLRFIKIMVATDRKVRPSCSSILRYFPLFWSEKHLNKFILWRHESGSLQKIIEDTFNAPCSSEHDIELAALEELGFQVEPHVGCMIVEKQCEWAIENYSYENVKENQRGTLTQRRKVSNGTSAHLNLGSSNSRPILTPSNSLEFQNDVMQLDAKQTQDSPEIKDEPGINGRFTQQNAEVMEESSSVVPSNKSEIQIFPSQSITNVISEGIKYDIAESYAGQVADINDVPNNIERESDSTGTNGNYNSVTQPDIEEMTNGYQEIFPDDKDSNFKQLGEGEVTKVKRIFKVVKTLDLNTIVREINTANLELQLTELLNHDNLSLLHVAVASREYEIVEYLVNQVGFSEVLFEQKYNNLIHICIENIGSVEIHRFKTICKVIELLVSKRPDLIQMKEPFYKQTPLHVVAMDDFRNDSKLKFIETLIQNNADVNATDSALQTPLHLVVRQSQQLMEIVQLLIKSGADPDTKDKNDMTFLHVAAHNTSPDVFHALVDYLVSIERTDSINTIDKQGCTAIHYAVQHFEAKEETLEILDQQGFNFNACDTNGNSLIFHAIKGGRSRSFIETLIDFDANVAISNNAKDTALHWAALYGNISALELLLSLGVDVNAKNLDGNTPLHTVLKLTEKHVTDVVKKLLEHNANVQILNGNGDLPITLAEKRIVDKGERMRVVELIKHASSAQK